MTVPNVLATRYAARRAGRDLVARAQDRARAAAVDRRPARPSATSASTCPTGSIEAYEKVVDQVDLASHRRPRAGHPPRREGPHRGVRRARRARAHPQGHDLPRPDRERRAARRSAVARARPRPRRRDPGPPRAGWRPSTRRTVMAGRSPQRRRAGDHARQALRHRRRRAADRASSASRSCSRATRCAASRARSAPRRTCSTCSAATPSKLADARAAGRRAPRLRPRAHQRRPGLPALARLRRGVRAGPAGRRRRPTWPPRSG